LNLVEYTSVSYQIGFKFWKKKYTVSCQPTYYICF